MKFSSIIWCCFSFVFLKGQVQNSDTSLKSKQWEISGDINNYFFTDAYIFLPVLKADRKHLHLEARYNYEDIGLLSAWAGYNFKGGNKLEYTFTPMVGAVSGKSYGLAPALEMNFVYKNFELYSESEYLFDLKNAENNFFYVWTDFTYAPKDWLWFGISDQRTRLFQTELDIQKGLLIGAGIKNWTFTTYVYNLFLDVPFFLLTLSFNY